MDKAFFDAWTPRALELAVVYCFVFLFLAAAGAGAWSIDAAWRRRA